VAKGKRVFPGQFQMMCYTDSHLDAPGKLVEEEGRNFMKLVAYAIQSKIYKEMNWAFGQDWNNLGVRSIRGAVSIDADTIDRTQVLHVVDGGMTLIRFHEDFLDEEKMKYLLFEALI
jgi:hypothetical protein